MKTKPALRSASPVAATVVMRAPALTPDPSPQGKGGDAPPEALVPPLPPLVVERDKPIWPRNEVEIDLPTAAPPPEPPFPTEPPVDVGYLGAVRVCCPGVKEPFDMDVLVTGPDTVVFGAAQLSSVQALRLCKLLLLAVRVCDARRNWRL